MAQSAIATAADYADAMMSARRAKNVVFLLLLLVLLGQLALFFLVRFGQVDLAVPGTLAVSVSATQSSVAAAPAAAPAEVRADRGEVLRYLVGFTTFLGLALTLLLAVVLLLIVMIMLVGRLIGVARLTSAFIWCVVLLVLLFPWQSFLNWGQLHERMRIPGVLYTYQELTEPRVTDRGLDINRQVVLWGRFVVFPVVALVILLMMQAKASRGLKLALGEADIETATDDTLPA